MINKNMLRKVIRWTGNKKRVLYMYNSDSNLRKRHEHYLDFINENFYASKFSHAYVRKRSIYTNAMLHLNNDYFVKLDVKNFFPSLNHSKLTEALYIELNRKNENVISIKECSEIVENCSVNRVGLPLGLITSPTLSNVYMKRFDGIFYGLLKGVNATNIIYTRYADDIFISFKQLGNESIKDTFGLIIKLCDNELSKQGLNINTKKTRTVNLNKSNHVKIAGINLVKFDNGTRRLTVNRNTVKDLYFEAINLYKDGQNISDIEKYGNTILRLKGMHAFLLSIEKTGYSHVLSEKMKESVTKLGYKNLEELMSKLGEKPAKD